VPHSYANICIHLIFSTKDRKNLISKEVQPRLWPYMASICRNHGILTMAINGTDNHAHALFHLPGTISLSKAVTVLKANSSRWMNEHQQGFAWQPGYGAFSVSQSNAEVVINYIRNQEQHHRKRRFEEEYLELLRKHEIQFDPNSVFG
jgi:putative transposase